VDDLPNPLRALTLWRPWPSAIFVAHPSAKRVENRGKPPPRAVLGQLIAIHAGQTVQQGEWPWPCELGIDVPRDGGPLGIVGLACVAGALDTSDDRSGARSARPRRRVIEVYPRSRYAPDEATRHRIETLDSDPWWAGPVGILLADVTPIEPVPCRGAMGYWRVPDATREIVDERWKAARRA
jgi:hypothetical protein